MVIASGPGSASRQAIGTGVFFGMIFLYPYFCFIFAFILYISKSPFLNYVFGVATKALPHDVLQGHILNIRHKIQGP